MAVLNKDILVQLSATRPENDTTTNIGGARDVDSKSSFSELSGNDQVTCISESTLDVTTFDITVTGKNSQGEIKSHVVTLTGQTGVDTPTGALNLLSKLLKVQQTAGAALNGAVAVRRKTAETGTGTTAQGGGVDADGQPYIDLAATASATEDIYNRMVIRTTGGVGPNQIREILKYNGTAVTPNFRAYVNADFATAPTATTTYEIHTGAVLDKTPTVITLVARPFYDAAANALGGAAKDIYDSIHVLNRNATKALTNATLTELTGGTVDDNITFAIVTSGLDTSSTNGVGNNRTVVGDFSTLVFKNDTDGAIAFANAGSLTAGAAQQVILKLTLAAGEAPDNDTWPFQVDGQSD